MVKLFSRFLKIVLVWICIWVIAPDLALARETYRGLVARLVSIAAANQLEKPELESALFRLANEFRRANGLPGLVEDQADHHASLAHAMDMMQHDYMGHVASTGQDFDSRMRALRDGAMILPSMGENAARLSHANVSDPQVAKKIFQQWVKSPPHRHALLSLDYVKVATGVVAQGDKVYADQIFVGPEVVTNIERTAPEGGDSLY